MELKLNKRRTFLIGFAFLAVLMLWRIYYHYVPLYLTSLLESTFGDKGEGHYNDIVGHIMSLDNLAALIFIPLFGWLSDRTKSKAGKRMPYIIWGALISLILFPLISVMFLVNSFAWYFVIVILLVITMAAWRSPAVSLMPDITPKPLRTAANGIINFMGYCGAILGAGLTMIFEFNKSETLTIIPFIVTSVVLAVVIIIFLLRFYENKTVKSVKAEMEEGERQSETLERVEEGKKLSARDKVNFGIMIAAVFFCWFGFNALETFGSLFAEAKNINWGTLATVLGISSLAFFFPTIWIAKKIGRKWSVMLGLTLIICSLVGAALFYTIFPLLVALIAVNGAGWAIVMVNSFPMVLEISTAKNVGRIAGIYYLVSEGAKFITANVSGYVFKWLGYDYFFWYAILFMSLAFIACFFYKTKKSAATLSNKSTPPKAPQETHKTTPQESQNPNS